MPTYPTSTAIPNCHSKIFQLNTPPNSPDRREPATPANADPVAVGAPNVSVMVVLGRTTIPGPRDTVSEPTTTTVLLACGPIAKVEPDMMTKDGTTETVTPLSVMTSVGIGATGTGLGVMIPLGPIAMGCPFCVTVTGGLPGLGKIIVVPPITIPEETRVVSAPFGRVEITAGGGVPGSGKTGIGIKVLWTDMPDGPTVNVCP